MMLLSQLLLLSTASANTFTIEEAHAKVAAMPDHDRADAVASLAVLSTNDPYVRASLQIPLALTTLVQRRSKAVPPAAREAWSVLEQRLQTQVAVLDALQVDLAFPTGRDALARADHELLVDRAMLASSSDPVGITNRYVRALPELAALVDRDRAVDLDAHNDRVEATTGVIRPCPRGPWAVLPGHSWTLGMELRKVEEALTAVGEEVHGTALQQDVEAMSALLAMWQRHSVD